MKLGKQAIPSTGLGGDTPFSKKQKKLTPFPLPLLDPVELETLQVIGGAWHSSHQSVTHTRQHVQPAETWTLDEETRTEHVPRGNVLPRP